MYKSVLFVGLVHVNNYVMNYKCCFNCRYDLQAENNNGSRSVAYGRRV